MTFEIHSDITNRSMTIASRTMRKVLRRKRSILWAIFDWSVFFINALLLIPFDGEPFTLDAGTVISLLVEVMLLSVLLFQDRLNGMIACKNALALLSSITKNWKQRIQKPMWFTGIRSSIILQSIIMELLLQKVNISFC